MSEKTPNEAPKDAKTPSDAKAEAATGNVRRARKHLKNAEEILTRLKRRWKAKPRNPSEKDDNSDYILAAG